MTFKMVAWSSVFVNGVAKSNFFRPILNGSVSGWKGKAANYVSVRCSSEKAFIVKESKYQYEKFKDLFIFYFLLGIIPLTVLATWANIFIGPAKLALIPEGYEPKPWEYHRHPITRFLAQYVAKSPQELYERNLHNLFVNAEKSMLKVLGVEINRQMKERLDYQAWYFQKPVTKYARYEKEHMEDLEFSEVGRKIGSLH